jgi:predicted kinase
MRYLKLFENFKFKVIVIIGLPGSGKTMLTNILKKDIPDCIVYDDFEIYEAMKDIGKSNMIISDGGIIEKPNTFLRKIKDLCEERNCVMEEIYFENDPKSCEINIRKRCKKMSDSEKRKEPHKNPIILIPQMEWYSSKYKIPENRKVIPVFK